MSLLIVLSLALLLVALLWLWRQPGEYSVERKQVFAQSPQALYDYILDYRSWSQWSPWVLHDAQTQLSYFGAAGQVGSGYAWQSGLIGEGRITTLDLVPGQRIAQDLQFIKPFRSQAQVQFEVQADGAQGCTVVWRMQSRLPWFMRPMRAMFERMIGTDFELGLARMVGALDARASHPRIRFVGVCERPAQTVLARPYSGSLQGLKDFWPEAMRTLAQQAGAAICGPALGVYHRIHMARQTTDCEAAVPVRPEAGLAGAKPLAGGRYFCVELRGDYRFLGMAWQAATGHVRMQKLRYAKSRPALEVYANDPSQHPDSNDWITELYVPIA